MSFVVRYQANEYGSMGLIPDERATFQQYESIHAGCQSVIVGAKTFLTCVAWHTINHLAIIARNPLHLENETLMKKVQELQHVWKVPIAIFQTFDEAYSWLQSNFTISRITIHGGATTIKQAMAHRYCDRIEIIDNPHCLDTHKTEYEYPDQRVYKRIPQLEHPVQENNLKVFVRRHEEEQYLNTIRNILHINGNSRDERTGTGTHSIFGIHARFDLSRSFPLITTKRVFFRGVVCELLWMLRGQTHNKYLQRQNVQIWTGNTTRAFLDKVGLTNNEEGDCGPIYGFQWRHWGATYNTANDDYTGRGIDQINNLISLLRTNKTSRRLVVSAWNVNDLHLMTLPPCHIFFQMYVENGRLNCQIYQRSLDFLVGSPFNIASYALLTHIIASMTDLQVGELTYCGGDAHIYNGGGHLEGAKEQITRTPYPFPQLKIINKRDTIEAWEAHDFVLENYTSHPSIKMEMAV